MIRRTVAAAATVLLAGASALVTDAASALPVERVTAFEAGAVRAAPAGPGTTILLMGIDIRSTLTRQELRKFHAGGQECNCTDSLMLVHVSAKRDRISVLGLPRDSLARIPEHRDPRSGAWVPGHDAKINAAFAEGGAPLSVRTVEEMTGVRVDRYLQVDFRRFIDSVNEVNGIDVCTSHHLDDPGTKLNLAPGTHHLGGGHALQYVRSRKVDGAADLGRIQRQQRFLVAALKKLRANPADLLHLSRTLLGSVKVDQGFKDSELAALAGVLTQLPASATEFATVPIAGFNDDIPGVGSTLRWDREQADEVFTRLREDRELTPKGSQQHPSDPPRLDAGYEPVRGAVLECG